MSDELEVGLLIQPVNTHDWVRFEAGEFGTEQPFTDAQVWETILKVGLLGEELAFDTLWITEHHRTPYGMCPNPLQFLAYLAGKTQRIDLGAAVVVLPWHDPVRVAEDIAQLQNMARGRRFRIGFGRGAAASEYEHLRIDQSLARERFDEGVEIVRKAIGSEEFSHDGAIFQIPPTTIRPRPVDATQLLDDFFCAFVGEPSLRAAAKSGLGMCFNVAKPYDFVRQDIDLFNSIRTEKGMDPVRPMIVKVMYCAETDEEAREIASRHITSYYNDANRHYRVEQVGNVRGYEHYKAGEIASDASSPDVLETSIWGSPERCLDQIRELREATDLSHLLVSAWYGEMTLEEAERSLRLFAGEVMPKLRSPQFA